MMYQSTAHSPGPGEEPSIPGQQWLVKKHGHQRAEGQERAEGKVLVSPHPLQRDQAETDQK
jgi:hypothetical protein